MLNLELEASIKLYSVTPKPGRWDFVNIEKTHNKNQLLMVRFIEVIHPPRYGEI